MTPADIAYITANFVPLVTLCAGRAETPADVPAWIGFGRPVSRDRLITAVRARVPELFR